MENWRSEWFVLLGAVVGAGIALLPQLVKGIIYLWRRKRSPWASDISLHKEISHIFDRREIRSESAELLGWSLGDDFYCGKISARLAEYSVLQTAEFLNKELQEHKSNLNDCYQRFSKNLPVVADLVHALNILADKSNLPPQKVIGAQDQAEMAMSILKTTYLDMLKHHRKIVIEGRRLGDYKVVRSL